MKCKFIFWVLLLTCVNGFSRNDNGFVDCGGLFLIDEVERHLSAWSCGAESELHAGQLQIDASVRHIHYGEYVHFDGTPKYGWDLNLERDVKLGKVGLFTDSRFLSVSAELSSLPYIEGSLGWKVPDSSLYASVSIGRGQFNLGEMDWHLEDKPVYVPDLEVSWKARFLMHRYSLGTVVLNRKIQADFVGVRGRPDWNDRFGLAISDTTDLWLGSLRYIKEGRNNGLKLWLLHAWGNVTLEGLHREKIDEGPIDEKRFLYVPLDFSASFAMLEMFFMRRPTVNRNDKISMWITYAAFDAELPYISWKDGRFYPTVAPNQALDNSVVKLISLNVYNSNFRVYGNAHIPLWIVGSTYAWKIERSGWKWKPSAGLHVFFSDSYLNLGRRIEKKVFLGLESKVDTLNWKLTAAGCALTFAFGVESPHERFFAETRVMQLIPVYYREHKLESANQLPSEVVFEENPQELPEDALDAPTQKPLDEGSKKQNIKPFKNGFAINASIGVRF